MKSIRWLTLFPALVVTAIVQAVPITFIHTGAGTGTLAGNPFSGEFIITGVGDTDQRQAFPVFFIDHETATIEIDGIGVLTFTTATRTFNNGLTVGFSRSGPSGLDLYNGPSNAAFATWDMQSSIGPIAGETQLLQWASTPVVTTGGVLIFDDAPSTGFFQAIVANQAPEPETLPLAGLALLALLLVRRLGRSR